MPSQTLQSFAPEVRREYWPLKDEQLSVLEAIEVLAERHHMCRRGVALVLDLAPNFVDRFFPVPS